MTEDLRASEPLDAARSGSQPRAGVLRRFLLPASVIAAIVVAILWLESRNDPGVSPTGERYGPVDLPVALQTASLKISAEEGSLAPDFLLQRLDGTELRLSDLRGQPVVLNFWATWCSPCRKEIPQLVQAYDRYRADGLVIVGINMQEGRSIAQPYVDSYGMEFPIAIDVDGEVGDNYRLLGLPVTFFIRRDGVIESVFTGPFEQKERNTDVRGAIEASELEQRIAAILAPETP